MDEHSQEYIAFMQKAEALQALWVPGVGDFIWCGEQGFYGLWIIVPRSEDNSPFGLAGLDHSGFFGVFSDLDELRPFVRGIGVWLPSLHDLLRIIEGAGWHWEKHGPALVAARCLGYHEDTDEHEYQTIREDIDDDLMLAAAKLAARAVEATDEAAD